MNQRLNTDCPRLVKLSDNADFLQIFGFNREVFRDLPLYLHTHDAFKLIKQT